MFKSTIALVTVALLGVPSATCFTLSNKPAGRPKTSLSMSSFEETGKKIAASFVAAAVMTNVVASPGFADDLPDYGSTQVVAARSGGRGGGRAYRAPPPSSSSRSYSRSSSTTIIRPSYSPSPVIVTPGFGYGFGYNPLGGFGLGYGLGSLGSAGSGYRDYQQESEIQRTKSELEAAKLKEQQLEERIRRLEMDNTYNQATQQAIQQKQAAPVSN